MDLVQDTDTGGGFSQYTDKNTCEWRGGWVNILMEIKVTRVELGHCTATNNSDWREDG